MIVLNSYYFTINFQTITSKIEKTRRSVNNYEFSALSSGMERKKDTTKGSVIAADIISAVTWEILLLLKYLTQPDCCGY